MIFLLLAPFFAQAATWESISDVDTHFFMQNPQLPWEKDPFRRAASEPKEKEPKPVLQGISHGGKKSIAIVDGRAVSVGDTVSGRKVVEIGTSYVVLEKKSSLIELRLPASSPASPPATLPADVKGKP